MYNTKLKFCELLTLQTLSLPNLYSTPFLTYLSTDFSKKSDSQSEDYKFQFFLEI